MVAAEIWETTKKKAMSLARTPPGQAQAASMMRLRGMLLFGLLLLFCLVQCRGG
jgi:hypothetical protein